MLSRKETLRTYSHLAAKQRVPSEYEIGSSDLLPYLRSGKFELDLPVARWYRTAQFDSRLQCEDWEAFSDPRKLTYTDYTAIRTVSEQFVDKVFSIIETGEGDKALTPQWVAALESVLAPMRYPYHAFQMVSAYIGQMAPSSKIAICCAFQAADEMRKIQRIAYRMGQLRVHYPAFGDQAKKTWEHDPLWQEIRKLLESLLVTWDWGEAFIALNVIVKPALEPVWMSDFSRLAKSSGDEYLEPIFSSLSEDCAWHREWSGSLVRHALDANPKNAEVIADWSAKWQPLAENAAEQLRDFLMAMKS